MEMWSPVATRHSKDMIYAGNRALVVMYHYVRESRGSSPAGIRPLFTNEFEKQLDWLENGFRIVSAEEFLLELNNGLKSSGKAPCLLTFDDGTRDHLEIVLPILQRRSLSGVFFVLTWPSEQQKMPVTQALHWALGLPEEQVWAKLRDFAETRLGGLQALGSAEDAMRIYHYETGLRGRIKYAVNFALAPAAAQEIIAEIVNDEGKPLKELANEWFLTEEGIKGLYSHGMEIGMHGSSHRSLTQIGTTGMEKEILHSSFYLERLLGKAPTWFCYPFGGSDLKQDVAPIHQACRKLGVKAIATTQKAFVTPETNVYDIPRYDCVHLPPRHNQMLTT
jgi:peptidoglycan/xylan/chitin deacetylase (PgdA/CDA1 family)